MEPSLKFDETKFQTRSRLLQQKKGSPYHFFLFYLPKKKFAIRLSSWSWSFEYCKFILRPHTIG
jgi:hypothetical protein